VANMLTAEELDEIRASAPDCVEDEASSDVAVMAADEMRSDDGSMIVDDESLAAPQADADKSSSTPWSKPGHRSVNRNHAGDSSGSNVAVGSTVPAGDGAGSPYSCGERERMRTRESKISTTCVGHQRERHEWWPIGTKLIGCIGMEQFTALVVENPRVKSGRSLRITSGPADGRICKTPTRAALEATEHYRQANNLGRSGGVTNGWTFWQPCL